MATITDVPVVDVNSDNFLEMWPSLLLSLKTSTFIALDLELSGLGNRRKLMAQLVDDRYKSISDVAKTRSILSLGLSCFRCCEKNSLNPPTIVSSSSNDSCENSLPLRSVETSTQEEGNAVGDKVGTPVTYTTQTFNIMALCNEDYIVEPKSLQFLVEHGFDFNKQYAKGVQYHRGNDKSGDIPDVSIRNLVSEIVSCHKPVVFHNGFIDLIFMYQNFYADLPAKMSSFLADMSEMFTSGIYDTKYVTEFKARMPASYLEYVFRRCQRQNELDHKDGQTYVHVQFPSYPSTQQSVSYQSCRLQSDSNGEMCQQFAFHGFCSSGSKCRKSHNISNILDNDFAAQKKKQIKNRKRKRKTSLSSTGIEEKSAESLVAENTAAPPGVDQDISVDTGYHENDSGQTSNGALKLSNYGNHRAGFDAFMTGFAMATFIVKYGKQDTDGGENNFMFSEAANKLSLSGKDMPLLITKSNFAKTSTEHSAKMSRLSNQSSVN